MSLILSAVCLLVGVVIGAYSHKWLAREEAKTSAAVSTAVSSEVKKV